MNVRTMGNSSDKCEDVVKGYWNSIPLWTKRIMVFSICLFIFSFFINLAILVNFPVVTIMKLRIYTVFTSFFVHTAIINLLFSLLMFVPRASTEENNIGSSIFFWDFLTKNVCMQISYTIIMMLVSFIVPIAGIFPAVGLWNIAVIYISQGSFKFPDYPMQLWCLPMKIAHIWYPPLLILIFMLFSGGPLFDLIISYAFAYLEFRFFDCSLYRFPLSCINSLSSCWLCKKLGMKPVESSYEQHDSNRSISTLNTSSGNTNNFKEFGGKGVAIGESPVEELPKVIDEEAEENYSSIPLNQNRNNPESNNYFSLLDEK